jgi:hypothetical protein
MIPEDFDGLAQTGDGQSFRRRRDAVNYRQEKQERTEADESHGRAPWVGRGILASAIADL